MARYVSQRTGKLPGGDQVRVAHEITGGNPLFLRALVTAWGADPPTDGAAAAGDRLAQKPELTHLFETQVARLSTGARGILEAASVIGLDGPLDVLAAASRRRVETLHEQLSRHDARSLLYATSEGRFRFVHDLVRRWLSSRARYDPVAA